MPNADITHTEVHIFFTTMHMLDLILVLLSLGSPALIHSWEDRL